MELSDGNLSSDISLDDLGMDSLAAAELADALQTDFDVKHGLQNLDEMTYKDLVSLVGVNLPASHDLPVKDSPTEQTRQDPQLMHSNDSDFLDTGSISSEPDKKMVDWALSPLEALLESTRSFEDCASKRAFSDYWSSVGLQQDQLTAAFIVEALCLLGVDLHSLEAG